MTMTFQEKLIALRKQKGWSQEELGSKLSVTRQTVSKWETGQTMPEMYKLKELGRIFEISIDLLLDEEAQKGETSLAAGRKMSRYHYEYKSKRSVRGLPLVHVNLGRGVYQAKGVIAIGNIAVGLISFGLISVGMISLGLVAVGLLFAFGNIALGGLALGGIAVGAVALGGLSIGVISAGGAAIGLYSFGGAAFARDIAMGGYASGHLAIGEKASGTIVFLTGGSLDRDAVALALENEFPKLWGWLYELILSLV